MSMFRILLALVLAARARVVQSEGGQWVPARAPLPAGHSAQTQVPVVSQPRTASPQRSGDTRMIFDKEFLPLVECAKLGLESGSLPDYNTCIENVATWAKLDNGKLVMSEAAIAGFIGGTVGTLGTAATALFKRNEVKDRLTCMYCEGSGRILCGKCLGAPGGCGQCDGGQGSVVCINCQGSGMAVPEELMQILGDAEAGGFNEGDLIGLIDEIDKPAAERNLSPRAVKKATKH